MKRSDTSYLPQASYAPWLAPTISVLSTILLLDAGLSIYSLVVSRKKQDLEKQDLGTALKPAASGGDEESDCSKLSKVDMNISVAVKGLLVSPAGHLQQPDEVRSPVYHQQISTDLWSPASEETAVPPCSDWSPNNSSLNRSATVEALAGEGIGRFRQGSTVQP